MFINYKGIVCLSLVGCSFSFLFGGWSDLLTTVSICMIIDYLSGFALSGFFKKSPKTKTGGLSSKIGFMGLIKKSLTISFIIIGYRFDVTLGTTYIKDAVCYAVIINEVLSIIENAGLMGIYIPKPLMSAIDILKQKDKSIN